MDWVNNEESFYNDLHGMYDKWIEAGDTLTKEHHLGEAIALAAHIATAIEKMPFAKGRYSGKDVREAAEQMMRDFEQYQDEAIQAVVKQAAYVPKPENSSMDPGEVEHAKKYDQLSRKIGIDRLKELVPVSPEKIRKALERGDKHLNTISLRKWDAAAQSIRESGLSLSDKVFALKHVATWHMAGRGGASMGATGTPELKADLLEDAVRQAFVSVYGRPVDPTYVERAIRSSYLESGRKLGWTDPNPDVVLVLTEFAWVHEPYSSEEDHANWDRVISILRARGWTGASWDSINAGVQMVFLDKHLGSFGPAGVKKPKFGSPEIVMTSGAKDAFADAENPKEYLDRHFSGDWGDAPPEDKAKNDRAISTKDMILSAYVLKNGKKIWIITDPGHEVTTILLPDEY